MVLATQVFNSGISDGDNMDCDNSNAAGVTGGTSSGAYIVGYTAPVRQSGGAEGEILKWISPPELRDKHQDAQQRRFEGVGTWLLQASEFGEWAYGSADPTLFCYGDAGAGKTCISSLVIDTLCSHVEPNFRVLYLYCDYPTYKNLSARDLIAGLLKQAMTGLDGIPEEVNREFEKSKHHGGDRGRPLLSDVVNMLGTVLTSFERAFICIDALDEFPLGQRVELLNSLEALIRQPSTTRLFLTGRPLIQHEIERCLGKSAQVVSIKPTEGDIKEYITQRLDRDPNPDEMNSQLKADIMRILPYKVSGIFLLAYIKMNAILEAVNVYERKARLLAMEDSPELRREYSKTLHRIVEQGSNKSKLATKVLMWLGYSKRPLHADELRHALAVKKGSKGSNPENISSARALSDCCLGLVTVHKESSTIRLIHSTLKDYLHDHPWLFWGTDLTIAETCLTYLNFEDIESLSPSLCVAPEETPFLRYASCYWGDHAREEATDHMRALAEKLLGLHAVPVPRDSQIVRIDKSWKSYWSRFARVTHLPHRHLRCQGLATLKQTGYDKHISAKLLLLEKCWPWGRDPRDLPHGFNGLHCSAFFGLQEMATAFLATEVPNSNRKDITGSTPLTWAARNGHEQLVQLLLKQNGIFDPEAGDNDGCTPFLWAARNGHERVVELFLQGGAINLETKDSLGRTPLSWASGNGRQEVVELLLGRREISPETKDYHGRTPLSWASGGGHRNVVQLLLGTGKACPNFADNDGRTPASWAAEAGYEGVVSFFLHQPDVGLNSSDRNGRSLLSRAAESGHWSVAKLLLGQAGIISDTRDNGGMTPLSWAASMGNEEVVKLFIEKGEARSGSPDKDFSTSLWWAAGSGHAGTVRLLLGWGGLNPNLVGECGQTPLARAAMHGHEQVVKLLLKSERVDRNLSDSFDRTPLSWAAGSWHDRVVELLLKSGGIDTELADTDHLTPLSWAARNGDEGIVQLLLKEGNAYPDSRDTKGRTPVSWAAGGGHKKLVDILLSWPGVNPNSVDRTGRTPLSWAAGNGREEATKLLLSCSNIEPDVADGAGRTPLSWAARNGCNEVVQLLTDHLDVNPDSTDGDNRTPLSQAAEEGHEKIISLLLGNNKVNPDSADCDDQTPLSWAARNGHEGIVRLLLQQESVNPHLADKYGRAPLSWAHENHHQSVVRVFQHHKPVSVSPSPPGPVLGPLPLAFNAQNQTRALGCLPLGFLACIIWCIFLLFFSFDLYLNICPPPRYLYR